MTTQMFDVPGNKWLELGPTPCILQNRGKQAVGYHIGTAAPAAIDAPAHNLPPLGGASIVSITLTNQKVYARAIWSGETPSVAFSNSGTGTDRFTAITSFVATVATPIPAGKLVQTLLVPGIQAGDALVTSLKTALPPGIALLDETIAPAVGKVTLSFLIQTAISALTATPVAIEFARLS